MSLKIYEETSIQAIADAIRAKNGSSDTYTVSQMATAISAIPSGGGNLDSNTLFQDGRFNSALTGSPTVLRNTAVNTPGDWQIDCDDNNELSYFQFTNALADASSEALLIFPTMIDFTNHTKININISSFPSHYLMADGTKGTPYGPGDNNKNRIWGVFSDTLINTNADFSSLPSNYIRSDSTTNQVRKIYIEIPSAYRKAQYFALSGFGGWYSIDKIWFE